jgi:hypothetical protein
MTRGPSNPSEPTDPAAAPPSPSLFFQTVNAYQRTAALRAAVELDLFTAIGEGGDSAAAALAGRCGAAERGVRILCDFLVVLGFLTKRDGRYGLTPDAATFLDRRSPAYAGGAIAFLLSPHVAGAFDHLTAAVRSGGTAMPEAGTVAPDHPVWVDFARAMAPRMAMPAEVLAALVTAGAADRPLRVLDLAAGHGLYGIALARRNPGSRVTAQDWPAVLAVAAQNARAAGLGDRFATLPGSAFDVDFGAGYDVVLLTNFLHHFDEPTCVTLLTKVRAALADGGRAVALEFIPDENRVSPPDSATFALTMLATTPAGDAYTAAEYGRMFRAAGFGQSDLHPLPPTMQRVVIARK